MQIRSIRKGFKAFECKFEEFESFWKHSNANSSHSKVFRSILMKFDPFERDSKHSNANSSHSKGIRSIQMLMLTTQKVFEAF